MPPLGYYPWMAKSKKGTSDLELIQNIKRLAVVSVFAEDEFLDLLALKGGNALDLALGVTTRASIDIDFSMCGAFSSNDLGRVEEKLRRSMELTFRDADLVVFDVELAEKPEYVSDHIAPFWGGYKIHFKVAFKRIFEEFGHSLEEIRKRSIQIGGKGKIEIDISKHEYIAPKQPSDMDGYRIFVYTPAMIVAEKLRAICQQMPEYASLVMKHQAARARDFFDIFSVVQHFSLEMTNDENLQLVKRMFDAKRVPLTLLTQISESKALHEQDFASVAATVRAREQIHEFDFYFEYVVNLALEIHSLRNP